MGKRRNGPRQGRGQRREQGRASEHDALPALSTLTELPAFGQLSPHASQTAAYETFQAEAAMREEAVEDLRLGCVVRLDRGFPAVLTKDAVLRAEFAARVTKGEFSRAAVGDWVCLRMPEGHQMARIEQILPRTSDIARWRGGSRGEKQTLAANVDVVVVVQALEKGRFSINRIARSALIAADCGASFAVVLTKCDLAGADEAARALRCVDEVLGEGCPAVAVSSVEADAEGLERVRALVPEGRIAIMLGPSGAGKSTLLNALLGREALQTGAVRESDGVGRHTTVTRRMVAIPGAGIIVDEPGLRTLQLVGHERGLSMVFPDIADAASSCRFRNCTHTHEPGCEVRARFADPADDLRLSTYLSLAAEMRESATVLDPDIVL